MSSSRVLVDPHVGSRCRACAQAVNAQRMATKRRLNAVIPSPAGGGDADRVPDPRPARLEREGARWCPLLRVVSPLFSLRAGATDSRLFRLVRAEPELVVGQHVVVRNAGWHGEWGDSPSTLRAG